MCSESFFVYTVYSLCSMLQCHVSHRMHACCKEFAEVDPGSTKYIDWCLREQHQKDGLSFDIYCINTYRRINKTALRILNSAKNTERTTKLCKDYSERFRNKRATTNHLFPSKMFAIQSKRKQAGWRVDTREQPCQGLKALDGSQGTEHQVYPTA